MLVKFCEKECLLYGVVREPHQPLAVPEQKATVPTVPEPVEGVEGPQIVSIFCGNEGGISPDELELLTKKALLQPVHFSVNILRCETAALYGIAAVQTAILGF